MSQQRIGFVQTSECGLIKKPTRIYSKQNHRLKWLFNLLEWSGSDTTKAHLLTYLLTWIFCALHSSLGWFRVRLCRPGPTGSSAFLYQNNTFPRVRSDRSYRDGINEQALSVKWSRVNVTLCKLTEQITIVRVESNRFSRDAISQLDMNTMMTNVNHQGLQCSVYSYNERHYSAS